MNNSKLTVKEAQAQYNEKGYNLRSWIRDGKVTAAMAGNHLLIDRASLEAHLAVRRQTKSERKNNADPVPPQSTNTQPSGPVPPSAEPSSVETPPVDAPPVAPPPVETPQVSAPEVEPPFDLHAGPQANPEAAQRTVSPGDTGQAPQGNASDRKRQAKEAFREARKKFKKGPVQYAKDAMRHLDLAQLRDVRNWLLNRMDVQMKLV